MKKSLIYLFVFVLSLNMVLSQTSDFNVSLTVSSPSCYDGIQNQGEEGVDCGGPCESCIVGDDGGSSGGSSGGPSGGAIVELPKKEDEFRKYYFRIKENEPIVNEINKTKLAIHAVEFNFINPVQNVTLEIKNVDNKLIIDKQDISDLTYQYFKISASNVKKEDIDYVKIWFKVDQEWLTGKNTIEEVLLLNYKDKWYPLDTYYNSNDSNYFYFETKSNSYGYFSIIGKEHEKLQPKIKPKTENPLKKFIDSSTTVSEETLVPESYFLYITYVLYGLAIFSLVGAGILIVKKVTFSKFPSWFHKKKIGSMKNKIENYREKIKEIDKKIKEL